MYPISVVIVGRPAWSSVLDACLRILDSRWASLAANLWRDRTRNSH